jgi:sulfite reductase (NADPH) flavoprotein alpha-component
VLDLVRDFGLAGTAAPDFTRMLRRMPARLYSIASSCRANPDEVDLLVAAVRYQAHQRQRFGTCSVYCAERVRPGDRLPVYVQSNDNFRLPADPEAPLIMVGPGTGVAPFRAFLEDREETGAAGKTWLFFGDRRFRTDFLYQTDWLRWLKLGVLTRMDVAFSRDGAEKVYVQHRMAQQGRELFAWLEAGAYFYVCGATDMAADVQAALEGIVRQHGARSAEDARDYVSRLQQQGRYQRDVY